MTIPNLVQNYQKLVFVNKVKQTYSIMANAYELSVMENGKPNTWNYANLDTTDTNYNKNFSDHMKNTVDKYFKPYLNIVDEGSDIFSYYITLKNGVTLLFYPDGGIDENNHFIQSRFYIIGSINGNHSSFTNKTRDYSHKDFIMEIRSNSDRLTFWAPNDLNTIESDSKYGCNKDV